MTDLQVIKLAVEHLKVLENVNQKRIGELLGYTNESSFSQVMNGKVRTPDDIFERLGALNEDVKNFINNTKNKSLAPDSKVNVITPEGKIINNGVSKNRESGLIPFYNADFMAGRSDLFYNDTNDHPDYYLDVPEFSGCIAFRAFGDSMEKIIKSSSILFGYKLDEDWRTYLEYGQIYGITMLNGQRYLKYIRRSEDHENAFLLKSENEKYDDFEVPKNKIKNLWLIQGWIDKRA